jgi:hypothetical protein
MRALLHRLALRACALIFPTLEALLLALGLAR